MSNLWLYQKLAVKQLEGFSLNNFYATEAAMTIRVLYYK